MVSGARPRGYFMTRDSLILLILYDHMMPLYGDCKRKDMRYVFQ